MKLLRHGIFALVATIMLVACSSHRDTVVKNGDTQPSLNDTFKEKITPESVRQHIADWPETSRTTCEQMMEKHGAPHGVTGDMLVWNDIAPYKRTIIHREGIRHDHSKRPHQDVLEHVTNEQTRICGEQQTISLN